jgi:hypothetical protein
MCLGDLRDLTFTHHDSIMGHLCLSSAYSAPESLFARIFVISDRVCAHLRICFRLSLKKPK